jgi:D-ribulokinase
MLGAVAGGVYGSIADAMTSMSAIGWLSEPTTPEIADFHRSKRRVHGLMRQLDRESRDAMHGSNLIADP